MDICLLKASSHNVGAQLYRQSVMMDEFIATVTECGEEFNLTITAPDPGKSHWQVNHEIIKSVVNPASHRVLQNSQVGCWNTKLPILSIKIQHFTLKQAASGYTSDLSKLAWTLVTTCSETVCGVVILPHTTNSVYRYCLRVLLPEVANRILLCISQQRCVSVCHL